MAAAIGPANLDPRLLPRKYRSYAADKNSQLHAACYYGDYDAALMLLLANHDTNVRNIWGESPLHHCTSQGHLEIMMLLLDANAGVNALDNEDLTPLHQALIHGNRDATELLLCYGAHIFNDENVTSDTRSPLELASHVHVCHPIVEQSKGHVWSLQHLCRIAIRKYLGVSKRRRMHELPLPRHLLTFLRSLPVASSDQLHANWERTRTTKSEAVKNRVESHRMKMIRRGPTGIGLQALRTGFNE